MKTRIVEIKYPVEEALKGRTLMTAELNQLLHSSFEESNAPVEVILKGKNVWLAATPEQQVVMCTTLKGNMHCWRVGIFANNELLNELNDSKYPTAMRTIVRFMDKQSEFDPNIFDFRIEEEKLAREEYEKNKDALS
jgi:hypothetical protein